MPSKDPGLHSLAVFKFQKPHSLVVVATNKTAVMDHALGSSQLHPSLRSDISKNQRGMWLEWSRLDLDLTPSENNLLSIGDRDEIEHSHKFKILRGSVLYVLGCFDAMTSRSSQVLAVVKGNSGGTCAMIMMR
jgi:hypothetical protein